MVFISQIYHVINQALKICIRPLVQCTVCTWINYTIFTLPAFMSKFCSVIGWGNSSIIGRLIPYIRKFILSFQLHNPPSPSTHTKKRTMVIGSTLNKSWCNGKWVNQPTTVYSNLYERSPLLLSLAISELNVVTLLIVTFWYLVKKFTVYSTNMSK